MYIQVIYHYPAIGKAADLLAALSERNKASNAEGVPHMVAQRMFGPEPEFVTATQLTDIGAIEAWQKRSSEPEFQAVVGKIYATLARPQSVELVEPILPVQPTGQVRYILSGSYFPARGKASELREALGKHVATLKAPGLIGAGYNTQIAPEEGATFTVNALFADLEGFESAIHDPAFRSSGVDASLLDRNIRQRLYQVLLPFARS